MYIQYVKIHTLSCRGYLKRKKVFNEKNVQVGSQQPPSEEASSTFTGPEGVSLNRWVPALFGLRTSPSPPANIPALQPKTKL